MRLIASGLGLAHQGRVFLTAAPFLDDRGLHLLVRRLDGRIDALALPAAAVEPPGSCGLACQFD